MNLMPMMTQAGGKQKCCVFRLPFNVSIENERISSGIEFQKTGAAERNDRKPKLVMVGVSGGGEDSAGRRNEENGLHG